MPGLTRHSTRDITQAIAALAYKFYFEHSRLSIRCINPVKWNTRKDKPLCNSDPVNLVCLCRWLTLITLNLYLKNKHADHNDSAVWGTYPIVFCYWNTRNVGSNPSRDTDTRIAYSPRSSVSYIDLLSTHGVLFIISKAHSELEHARGCNTRKAEAE
jgi:hypothetical protein